MATLDMCSNGDGKLVTIFFFSQILGHWFIYLFIFAQLFCAFFFFLFLRLGPPQVVQVADALDAQLPSTDQMTEGGEAKGDEREGKRPLPSSGHQISSTGPLVISC